MTTTRTREFLLESELFRNLSDEEIEEISPLLRERSFKAGDILFHEGELSDEVYVVARGKVAIEISLKLGGSVNRRCTIETATEGHVVGWSAVLGSPTVASAFCLEDADTLAISGTDLRRVLSDDQGLEAEVMKAVAHLTRSRLASVRNTLANILCIASHDLKAPLHAVESYHQVILGGYAGEVTDKQRMMLLRSSERIQGLVNLIDDILDLSRLHAGCIEKELVSLTELAETSIENVIPRIREKHIQFLADWPADLGCIEAHSGRIQQLITNLVGNAVKFTPEHGRVIVRMRDIGEKMRIEVIDDGPGVPPEEIGRIFDDFYKGETGHSGAGLGLAIARRIVEAHRGRIWAQSPHDEFDGGTKLVVTLPKTLAERDLQQRGDI